MRIRLFSSTFLWIDHDRCVLYNTEQNTSLVYPLCPEIRDLCNQWQIIENLYVAKKNGDQRTRAENFFFKEIETRNLGVLEDDLTNNISFPPLLKIDHSIESINRFELNAKHTDVLGYLMSLKVFLGGNAENSGLSRQVMYPMSSKIRLDDSRLLSFINKCDKLTLFHIDLVISEWNRDHIFQFASRLNGIKERIRFYFAHPDPGFNNEIIDYLVNEGYALTQVCLHNADQETASHITKNRNYLLLVRDEEDVNFWEASFGEKSVAHYELKPVADNNLAFFQKDVFLSEEDILSQKLSKKDIFRHQALNVNQFGTLYVFPDGTIHPAPDAPVIGTLEDSVHEIIIRELEENHAWRQTRDLMTPCKNCLYRYLCPSPSVYERIFGVPGCTYWKE